MSATPECIESIVLAYIRLWGVLSVNQREVIRRFEVERGVSGGFVVCALFFRATTPCARIGATLPF